MSLFLAASPRPEPPQGTAETLCFGWAALCSLRDRGLPARVWDDDLPKAWHPGLREAARRAAFAWHFHEGADFTRIGHVSLGGGFSFVHWADMMTPLYKLAASIKAAAERTGAKTVYCESSLPKLFIDALPSLCRSSGLELRMTPSEPDPFGLSYNWSVSLPEWKPLKRRLASIFNAVSPKRRGRKHLLVYYYPSLWSVIRLAASGMRVTLAECPRPAQAISLLPQGPRLLTELHEPPPKYLHPLTAEVHKGWARAKADSRYRASFTWEGLDPFPAIEARIDAWMSRESDAFAWAADSLLRWWERELPSVAVLSSDGDPIQHMIGDIARAFGVPCAVMQHGLPWRHSETAYEDDNSSHFITWTPAHQALYQPHNSVPGRVYRTAGNPAFDRYAGRIAAPPRRIRRVLVLSSPNVRLSFEVSELDRDRYITTVMAVLGKRTGLELALKLHPSESEEYYRRILSGAPRLPIVERSRPLDDCLAECDLVVGSFSTAMLEAMLAGRPVICVNLTKSVFSPPLDGNSGVLCASTIEELEAALDEAENFPSRFVARLLAEQARALEVYAGSRNGTASLDAAKLLKELAV